jgi:hypothetical protein
MRQQKNTEFFPQHIPFRDRHVVAERLFAMLIEKLVRLSHPVPLLAAFPFQIQVEAESVSAPAAQIINGKRDYSTCVQEESVCPIFGKSKNDVKKDD